MNDPIDERTAVEEGLHLVVTNKEKMGSVWQLDPRGIIFPITKPPPKSWADISLVHGRVSRHWGLIRGLIVSSKSRTPLPWV